MIDREWEQKFIASAGLYPTVEEYAQMAAAKVDQVTDELMHTCLDDLSGDHIRQMKGMLMLLARAKDSRTKPAALRCARQQADYKLKLLAFKVLNAIKEDAEIEQFFVDYLLENRDAHSLLVQIANRYWD